MITNHHHQCTNIPGWSSAPSSFQCSECDPGYNSWTSYTGLNISDDDTDNANDAEHADDAGDKCLWLRWLDLLHQLAIIMLVMVMLVLVVIYIFVCHAWKILSSEWERKHIQEIMIRFVCILQAVEILMSAAMEVTTVPLQTIFVQTQLVIWQLFSITIRLDFKKPMKVNSSNGQIYQNVL